MIRRPPRSTLDRSSAASDVYKRQDLDLALAGLDHVIDILRALHGGLVRQLALHDIDAVSYTHLRAHKTVLDLVCRLLLEKKKTKQKYNTTIKNIE